MKGAVETRRSTTFVIVCNHQQVIRRFPRALRLCDFSLNALLKVPKVLHRKYITKDKPTFEV